MPCLFASLRSLKSYCLAVSRTLELVPCPPRTSGMIKNIELIISRALQNEFQKKGITLQSAVVFCASLKGSWQRFPFAKVHQSPFWEKAKAATLHVCWVLILKSFHFPCVILQWFSLQSWCFLVVWFMDSGMCEPTDKITKQCWAIFSTLPKRWEGIMKDFWCKSKNISNMRWSLLKAFFPVLLQNQMSGISGSREKEVVTKVSVNFQKVRCPALFNKFACTVTLALMAKMEASLLGIFERQSLRSKASLHSDFFPTRQKRQIVKSL